MTITNSNKNYSAYSSLVTYAVGDKVYYLNQLYQCKLIALNKVPTNTTYWNILWSDSDKETTATFTNSDKI